MDTYQTPKLMRSNLKPFAFTQGRIIFSLMMVCLFSGNVFSQEGINDGFNPNSVRPVHESDIFFKKSLVRAMDLREKQNKPMFSRNREITRVLIEAVQNGKLTPYSNDSLATVISIDEFMERMSIPSALAKFDINNPDDTMNAYIEYGPDWRTEMKGQMQTQYYFPQDLYQMEIKEDIIFNKETSRMTYDIHSITIFVPADHPSNVRGIQSTVASFKFKDLVNDTFRDNPNAIWFNAQNDATHLSLADAFELRLFSSYIIKVSNPSDAYLSDIYNDQYKGILASQWAAHELLEFEHNLWEF
jgi:gliding motility associated protien GldN